MGSSAAELEILMQDHHIFVMNRFFYLSERRKNDVENLMLLNKCQILLSNVRFF